MTFLRIPEFHPIAWGLKPNHESIGLLRGFMPKYRKSVTYLNWPHVTSKRSFYISGQNEGEADAISNMLPLMLMMSDDSTGEDGEAVNKKYIYNFNLGATFSINNLFTSVWKFLNFYKSIKILEKIMFLKLCIHLDVDYT